MATNQRIGIYGSARIEGIGRVGGNITASGGVDAGGAAVMGNASPAVKRAMWFWIGAVVVLAIFHVGGASLGE